VQVSGLTTDLHGILDFSGSWLPGFLTRFWLVG
jgi:hypothetical protein